jgi:hypothetical protein
VPTTCVVGSQREIPTRRYQAAALADLDSEFVGIGHNQPPEPIEESSLTIDDVLAARSDVATLTKELQEPAPDRILLDAKRNRLVEFE